MWRTEQSHWERDLNIFTTFLLLGGGLCSGFQVWPASIVFTHTHTHKKRTHARTHTHTHTHTHIYIHINTHAQHTRSTHTSARAQMSKMSTIYKIIRSVVQISISFFFFNNTKTLCYYISAAVLLYWWFDDLLLHPQRCFNFKLMCDFK